MVWNIKQMAKMSKIPVDTLRYYDKLKIVSPKRGENGYRYYDEKDYFYLQCVSTMKYGSFSLNDIKTVVQSFDMEGSPECYKQNFDIFSSGRTKLIKRIEDYQVFVKILDKLIVIMDGTKNYYEYKDDIVIFVQELFNQINGMPNNT